MVKILDLFLEKIHTCFKAFLWLFCNGKEPYQSGHKRVQKSHHTKTTICVKFSPLYIADMLRSAVAATVIGSAAAFAPAALPSFGRTAAGLFPPLFLCAPAPLRGRHDVI